jgi:GTP pyrophosphokinase
MDEKLEKLVTLIKGYSPDADVELLEKAYAVASQAHEGQLRASGEPYFVHCYAVATILTDLKLDVTTITASLLHDTIEDTPVTVADIRREFGPEISVMVEGVTKISSYHFPDREIAQAENWRRMLLAITKDIRVILIKLADRLHNLRTIGYLPGEKQRVIAGESLNLYAPFAQRLGIYRWKSEMEDLSFAVLRPDEYRSLLEQWESRQEINAQSIERWRLRLEESIRPSGIPARLSARPKSLYGIFKKMERQHKPFVEIQDLIGLRLITDSIANCYALLSIVQTGFPVVAGSFTDYIATPKMNMYQSIHITIEGPDRAIAELQIRTEEMHRRCEYGIAAHWRYKEQADGMKRPGREHSTVIEEKLDWLRQVLEWQSELKDAREFMETFKTECTFDQIFVFTPQGKVVVLPQNSTPIDFAYAVHSQIGDSCFGAKVSGRLVPLDTRLNSGEVCEILTRKNAHPHEHWLKAVITARARAKIRKYLHEHPEATTGAK